MALTVPILYQSFLQNRARGAFPFLGDPFERLALGLASGIVQWGIAQPANLALSGVASGFAGAGSITVPSSRLVIPTNISVMLAALSGAGLNGVLAESLATVVTMGLVQAFGSNGQYTGSSAGVGVGLDVSRISIANSSSLVGTLNQTLSGSMGLGGALPMMAMGLGTGIASLLLLGTGTASITGATTVPQTTITSNTTAMVI